MITVRAETNVLGLAYGETTTVADTPFIRAVIASGRLQLVEEAEEPPPLPRRRRAEAGA